MAKDIVDEFLGGSGSTAASSAVQNNSSRDIVDEFLTPSEVQTKPEKSTTENITGGFKKGILNVANTLKGPTDYLSEGIGNLIGAKGTQGSFERGQESIKQQNKLYDKEYGDSTAAEVGKVGGEIVASAPLLPVKGIQAVRGAMGALPTVLSTGEKIAAPLINRLGASSVTGAIGGGVYGAATSAGNDKSLARNIGENALGGAVGGPILDRAGALASKVIPSASSVLGNANVNLIANKYNINPKAARQILTELENEGMTVAEAEAQINKLGPDATIADLTPALQDFVGAIGKRGGRAEAIVKNRFSNRADLADDTAHNMMVSKLGPKPDVQIERGKILGTEAEAIHKEAERLTSGDYKLAHKSTQKLDAKPTVDAIDTALKNAVGTKATKLNEIRGYLFTPDGKLKNNVSALHEVRQGIDDIINKQGDSLPPNASRAVNKVRDLVDAELKTNSEMAAADAKFAAKMDIKKGLQIGYEALNKGNFEQFERTFNGSNPDIQATIKKGLRAKIGDMMESAARGELAGAQQLLGKKSANRKKLELAFGKDGVDVLNALESEATKRLTERTAKTGSITAKALRINALFDNPHPKGFLADMAVGAALDSTTGSLGTGTAVMAAKRGIGNIATKFGEKRKDAFAEGTADLISQSGPAVRNSLRALDKIGTIQNKLKINPSSVRLPLTASSVVGNPLIDYQNYKDIKDRFTK